MEWAVAGLSPLGQGSKAVGTLAEAPASSSATAKPAAGRFSSWWNSNLTGTEPRQAMRRPQTRVEPRPQPGQWVSLMGPVDRWKRPRIVFQHGAGFDFVGQAAERLAVADREACLAQELSHFPGEAAEIARRSQRIAPIVPPGSIRPAEVRARKGKGAKEAPDEASWPASALIETARARPSHQGAIMPPAQPIREQPM